MQVCVGPVKVNGDKESLIIQMIPVLSFYHYKSKKYPEVKLTFFSEQTFVAKLT